MGDVMVESNLQRFLDAQRGDYELALSEIKGGRKYSHWMWYIFPQIAGLGHSSTAQYYAIADLAEAKAYLSHPLLGSRLKEISKALLGLDETDPVNILGGIDAIKLRSCMTLFHLAVPEEKIFMDILAKFYNGTLDELTVDLAKK